MDRHRWVRQARERSMRIDNPKAKTALVLALKDCGYDCCTWDYEVLESLALEIIVSLGARGLFIVDMIE